MDPKVNSILIAFDSPGGNADGVAELEGVVNQVRASGIPVWGWVDGMAASGAYWIAANCDQIYVSSINAMVGSIGAVTILADESGTVKDSGVKIYKLDTGPFKAIGTGYSPITKEQIAMVQERVNAIGTDFAATVASGRGISVEIGSGVADGRVFRAEEAKSLGMIDGIAPLDSVLTRMNMGVALTSKDRPKYKG